MRAAWLALLSMLPLMSIGAPAAAETRWLACKFNTAQGVAQNFHLMFDESRNVAAVFDPNLGTRVEGKSTAFNFQFIRPRLPQYALS